MIRIHVLIPSYNCSEWIDRTLLSVASQTCPPDSVLVIDDASDDLDYRQQLDMLCVKYGFRLRRNSTNMRCPANIYYGVRSLDAGSDDVIFLLDGDDFLPPETLERIVQVYAAPGVWLTYGNYEPHPHNTGQTLAKAYGEDVITARSFRTANTCFNHPLTFRRFLFDALGPADLQNDAGRWFRGGYDSAIMIPMLEMAAPDHFRFLDEVLYYYNSVNPNSDSSIHRDEVNEATQIRSRPMKAPL